MTTLSVRGALGAATLAAAASVLTGVAPAHAVPTWASAATAAIHPGVQTITAGGQCTANFVFYDSSNNVYIGQAAHCASTSGNTVTDGCVAGSRALNTAVTVGGATRSGTLVYSSWLTMQAPGANPTADECAHNDFALVKLDPADYGRVNPSIPFWGGPTAVLTTGAPFGTQVYSYGNSSLRFGISTLSPKEGVTTTSGDTGSSWPHQVYTATPGIPGDSGSAFLDRDGKALGVLATLSADGSNGVNDVNHLLTYLRAHSSFTSLQLALGTESFNGTNPAVMIDEPLPL
jgi:hypothetical protein